MATNITDWVKKIAPYVPFCPDPVIEEYIIDILRDFCHFTRIWDDNELTAINIEDEVHTYTLSSSDGDIVSVDHAQVDDVPIRPVSLDELNKPQIHGRIWQSTYWRQLEAPRATMYIVGMTDNIRLIYTPSEDITGGLAVWVSLKPLETATTVEDFLWNEFKDVITEGTVAKLLGIKGRPWTDLKESLLRQELYEASRFTAFNLKQTGRTRLEMKATPVFFA